MRPALRPAAILLAGLGLATPAAAHTPNAMAFVDAFRAVCLPQRQSYQGMVDLAGSLGWQPALPGSNPELDAVFRIADKAIEDDGNRVKMISSAYERIVSGTLHHLILARIVAPEVPEVTSCSLYDFAATAIIESAIVTDLVGAPEKRLYKYDGLRAYSWGDSPAMPGTFQTVLTFVAEDSPQVEKTGFSGLVLKIDSSPAGSR